MYGTIAFLFSVFCLLFCMYFTKRVLFSDD